MSVIPINWLQVTNFVLNCVKKPRQTYGYACVFCLTQNKIDSLSPNHGNLDML